MMNFKNTILLTGAGFTANFGGFLAREMWSKIFNNPEIDKAGKIKYALHEYFDFEKMYSNVFDDRQQFPQDELEIYKKVVADAFKAMNDYLIESDEAKSVSTDRTAVANFLSEFLNKTDDKIGAYFTLNQDMFPEMKYNWHPLGPKVCDSIRPNMNIKLPTKEELEEYRANMPEVDIYYVKLHGSVNWLDAGDGEAMALGVNKPEAINKIPLLAWYFDLFREAISRNETKLLIIGYGFRDEHINKCLFDAINEYGLQLYVISPEDPAFFKKKLTTKGEYDGYNGRASEISNEGTTIWRAVKAYFPYKLSDIFPFSGKRTAALDELLKTLSS
jgi:hypothetical protein